MLSIVVVHKMLSIAWYIDFVAAPDGYNKPLRPIELDQETRKCEVVYNAGTPLPPLPTAKKKVNS